MHLIGATARHYCTKNVHGAGIRFKTGPDPAHAARF